MGLLSKANDLNNLDTFAFVDFIKENNIKTFAIFQKNNNFYDIVNSLGFDGPSLLSSHSSQDYWDGICPENNKVYNFTSKDKTITPIMQFFSFKMEDSISSVSLYKEKDYIFMLCNKEFSKETLTNLKKINYNKDIIDLKKINNRLTQDITLNEYIIDFNDALTNYVIIKQINDGRVHKIKDTIFNELYNRFRIYFSPYSTKLISNYTIKVLINTNRFIKEEHLIKHITYQLKSVISKSAELIKFSNFGIAESIKEINTFLQVE